MEMLFDKLNCITHYFEALPAGGCLQLAKEHFICLVIVKVMLLHIFQTSMFCSWTSTYINAYESICVTATHALCIHNQAWIFQADGRLARKNIRA